jgi:hypothetical protein
VEQLYNRRRLSAQNGAVMVFLALGVLAILIGLAAIVLNYDMGSYVKRAGQNAIDTAALSAVNTFCSSRACFADSLEVATDSLEEHLPAALDLGVPLTLAAGSGPEWTVSDLKVTIQRGRWWPDGVPSNLSAYITTHLNGNFEPIDWIDTSVSDWQSTFPGIPAHVVANALYVKIEYKYKHKILNIYSPVSSNIVQETYAAAGQLKGANVCAAPFALHVCSLLNQTGEYDKDVNCRFERHFTNANRYCPSDDPDCEVLPGTLWTPAIDESDYNFWGNLTPAGLTADRVHKYRSLCSWETYPRATDVRDHYGLVGLPYVATIDGTINEEKVLSVIDSPQASSNVSGGCTSTRLGDEFVVLEDGLTNNVTIDDVNPAYASSDELVWSQIQDSTEGTTFHPDFKDSMLKTGFPSIRTIDDLWARDSEDLTFHDSRLNCSAWPRTRYGHCNSKHLVLNNDCRAGEAPAYWDCSRFGGCTCDFMFAGSGK